MDQNISAPTAPRENNAMNLEFAFQDQNQLTHQTIMLVAANQIMIAIQLINAMSSITAFQVTIPLKPLQWWRNAESKELKNQGSSAHLALTAMSSDGALESQLTHQPQLLLSAHTTVTV